MKTKNYFFISVIIWACFILFVIFSKFSIDYSDPEPLLMETKFEDEIEEIEIQDIIEQEIFYSLSEDERYLVESIVAGESGIEPYWGKVGVASCILNACLKDNIRPEEVQSKYKYSGWKPIEEFESECLKAYGNTDLSDEVREAVSQVFDRGEVLSNEILWFYNPKYSEGKFHNTQKFIIEIGNHKFFGEK